MLEKGRQESYRFALMLWKHARVFRRDWSSSISDGCITLDDPVLHRLREINDSDETSRLCMCMFILGLAGSVMNSCLGLKHVYCMYILAQDQNGLVRSNTTDLRFSARCLLVVRYQLSKGCLPAFW